MDSKLRTQLKHTYVKTYLVYIIIFIISVLSTFSITTYIHNKNKSLKIEETLKKIDELHIITHTEPQTNNKELIKIILDKQNQEDIFLSQLSNNTTIILSSIGFILAIGGMLSFKNIDDRLKNSEGEINSFTSLLNKEILAMKQNQEDSNITTKKWITETRFTFKEYSYESNLILADINFNQNNITEFIRLKKRGILDLFDCINYILYKAAENNEREKVNIPIYFITLAKEISNLIKNYPDKLNANDIKLWEEEVIHLLPISSPAIKNDFIELLKIINNK